MLLRALKMVVLPLIIFSIIASIASLDRKTTGKLGGVAVAYYAVTTFIAVIIGIILSGNFNQYKIAGEIKIPDKFRVFSVI